jgi:hypothetical protein
MSDMRAQLFKSMEQFLVTYGPPSLDGYTSLAWLRHIRCLVLDSTRDAQPLLPINFQFASQPTFIHSYHSHFQDDIGPSQLVKPWLTL